MVGHPAQHPALVHGLVVPAAMMLAGRSWRLTGHRNDVPAGHHHAVSSGLPHASAAILLLSLGL